MKLNRRGILGLAAAAVVAGGGAAFAATGSVSAAPVSAVTHVYNDPDSGNGGTWATDAFDRTVTVTLGSQAGVTAGFTKYSAHVSDTGTFETVPGARTPNQSVAGQVISHAVGGTFSGAADYTVLAPSTDAVGAASSFPATLNANFHALTGPQSTSLWPEQAFASTAGLTVTLADWGWTYATPAGESWTDSSAAGNADGNVVADGNITGLLAPPPVVIRLSHGHGTATAPTRETVSYQQSGAASWDMFYIVGPGGIDGHKGWVNAKLGLNFGYYSGLEAGHGYTAYYTPVTGQGSETQVPGSHGGYVYFVS